MKSRAKQTGEPGTITCPACQSKITSDGKTLQSRSEFLADLQESEEAIKKMEQAVEKGETRIVKLQEELNAANEKIKQLESKIPKEGESGTTRGRSRVGRLW